MSIIRLMLTANTALSSSVQKHLLSRMPLTPLTSARHFSVLLDRKQPGSIHNLTHFKILFIVLTEKLQYSEWGFALILIIITETRKYQRKIDSYDSKTQFKETNRHMTTWTRNTWLHTPLSWLTSCEFSHIKTNDGTTEMWNVKLTEHLCDARKTNVWRWWEWDLCFQWRNDSDDHTLWPWRISFSKSIFILKYCIWCVLNSSLWIPLLLFARPAHLTSNSLSSASDWLTLIFFRRFHTFCIVRPRAAPHSGSGFTHSENESLRQSVNRWYMLRAEQQNKRKTAGGV